MRVEPGAAPVATKELDDEKSESMARLAIAVGEIQ
tara:strand:+ start:570 stop:674 length:105 start_codon:yes stop_codon:yes gene_type:complete